VVATALLHSNYPEIAENGSIHVCTDVEKKRRQVD
jgi:hypothetical protein